MRRCLLILLVIGATGAALADSPPADTAAPLLRHDPFRRPGGTQAGTTAPTVEVEWRPRLRGVLLAGRRSLANVEGQMVGIGESLDGHRLLSVTDYQAVFQKDGRRITLDMRRPPREPSP